jgi:hypothetical protein
MSITAATQEGDAESSMLADRDEDFNTRYGGYMGYMMAFERLKLVPRHTPDLDLVAMGEEAGAGSAADGVDYFIARLLRREWERDDREALVGFLRDELGGDRIERPGAQTESALRSLLYLVLSTPEYQLA